jgi:hypothetical protein
MPLLLRLDEGRLALLHRRAASCGSILLAPGNNIGAGPLLSCNPADLLIQGEMLCVAYAERSSDALHSMCDQDIVVVRIPRDASEWEGDDAVWRQLLLEHFTSERR